MIFQRSLFFPLFFFSPFFPGFSFHYLRNSLDLLELFYCNYIARVSAVLCLFEFHIFFRSARKFKPSGRALKLEHVGTSPWYRIVFVNGEALFTVRKVSIQQFGKPLYPLYSRDRYQQLLLIMYKESLVLQNTFFFLNTRKLVLRDVNLTKMSFI